MDVSQYVEDNRLYFWSTINREDWLSLNTLWEQQQEGDEDE